MCSWQSLAPNCSSFVIQSRDQNRGTRIQNIEVTNHEITLINYEINHPQLSVTYNAFFGVNINPVKYNPCTKNRSKRFPEHFRVQPPFLPSRDMDQPISAYIISVILINPYFENPTNRHQTSDRYFILKGINGTSIRNAFECHGRRVRVTRATGKCIFTEKAPTYVQFLNKLRVLKCPYLENYQSF
jgi:hypothetical protein